MVSGKRRKEEGFYKLERLQWMTSSIQISLSDPPPKRSLYLRHLSILLGTRVVYSVLAFVDLNPFISMTPKQNEKHGNGGRKASKLGVSKASREGDNPTIFGRSNESSGRFQDYGLIEFLDMTGEPLKQSPDHFFEPVLDLDIGADAGGKFQHLCFCQR